MVFGIEANGNDLPETSIRYERDKSGKKKKNILISSTLRLILIKISVSVNKVETNRKIVAYRFAFRQGGKL